MESCCVDGIYYITIWYDLGEIECCSGTDTYSRYLTYTG